MKFDIITLFPESINFKYSLIGKAIEKGLCEVNTVDLRKYGFGNRLQIDDRPFGGGPGMVMMIEPLYNCLKELDVVENRPASTKVILTAAGGQKWQQSMAEQYAANVERLVIICGHYEGVDARIREFIDAEISIGEYVLTGGELPAMVMTDTIVRLLPGVVGNPESLVEESHTSLPKEYPQYTRPEIFKPVDGRELKVPDVLLSGNHKQINDWRAANAH